MSINFAEPGCGATINSSHLHSSVVSLTTEQLIGGCEAEVLSFLAERPLHTVCMTGLILDNGLVSPMNRGVFYACRDGAGQLESVALIGHATLIEARSNKAVEAFALLARDNPDSHLVRGEQEMIERFWNSYRPAGYSPRSVCRELLLEQRESLLAYEPVSNLRPATLDDLESVIAVNASMIFDECGVNPLEGDLAGFRQRTARRIEQARIWVWIENGRLVFKTDVIFDTPEVAYLEGVYVNPDERGKGYGLRCFSQLCQRMLQYTKSLCLLVNENNQSAINFYYKAGYKLRGSYDTIYLQRESS